MPVITHYNIDEERVSAKDVGRFADSLKHGSDYYGYPEASDEWLEWKPNAPFCKYGTHYGLADEALSRSNHRVIAENFEENHPDTVDVCEFSIMIHPKDRSAIARAYLWGYKLDRYPVACEDDFFDLEQELLDEAYDDYGKDEVIEWLRENGNPLGLLDEDEEPIVELDRYLLKLFRNCHSYNGEAYVNDSSMYHALQDVRYEMRIEFERAQPPLTEEG